MAELETIAIRSPKNPAERWNINWIDYDPDQHVLWETPIDEPEEESIGAPNEPRGIVPSVPDFEEDVETGNITGVNIINPDRQTSRLTIRVEDYDPDQHRLWSTHPRFSPK